MSEMREVHRVNKTRVPLKLKRMFRCSCLFGINFSPTRDSSKRQRKTYTPAAGEANDLGGATAAAPIAVSSTEAFRA